MAGAMGDGDPAGPEDAMTAPRVSAAINTLNEEQSLPFALRSVRPWVDEIVVVDMHSDDRTVEVARQFGAEIHLHERMHYADPARAFAVEKCRGDWVLILDADELVPAPLSRALRALVASGAADAVRLPRLNYIFGDVVHHGGWGAEQDRQLRFFRRGAVQLSHQIHAFIQPAPGARVTDLPGGLGLALVHFNYVDASDFLQRLDRYTTVEARLALERGETLGAAKTVAAAAREFAARYLRRQGFRDGWRGAILAAFMAFYRLAAAAKLHELRSSGPREAVVERYRKLAEDVLGSYEDPSAASR